MENRTEKRCGEIELFRFIFSIIILIRHSEYLIGDRAYFAGGAFGVEFFLLISGYLMMSSIEKLSSDSLISLGNETRSFIAKKIRTLYPEVLISACIAFVIQCVAKSLGLIGAIKLALRSVPEVLLLSQTGLGEEPLNSPVWYLSAMLLAMIFLYPLLRKYKDIMVQIVMPLTAVFLLGYLIQEHGSFRNPTKWLSFVYKGFLRSVGEICLGVELYYIAQQLSHLCFTYIGKLTLTIVKWFCWILVIRYMTEETAKYDAFFLCILMVAIALSFSGKCLDYDLFSRKSVFFLGKLSFPLYLNHCYFSRYLGEFLSESIDLQQQMLIYFIVSLITALFVMWLSRILRMYSRCYGNRIKAIFIEADDIAL